MKVIVVRPLQAPAVEEIGDSLYDMQAVVGGYIEVLMPWRDGVALVCNEEGKICGLPDNRKITDVNGQPVDIIAGTFFLCSASVESGEFDSLPDSLIPKYLRMFAIK